jgi:type IV pilus assembly protein PilM
MAQKSSVWGIEIGQSALKALRCRLDGDAIVAEAFDYIEYPKILSQPEAEPEVMVREALETFVGRNDLRKCKVALSVPGQSGLAKFFKPPPVELKKIPDIVKYEAKQQIPFDLKDVIWDYQLMAGGDISDGFALESEVGLFAMKRDAVYRALKPLQVADIEIDLLQLAPLSIYNMVTEDRALVGQDTPYDPEHPPKSTVVLAMGTDATDLIVTNGYRVWQRSMPLGGNHFTRQLTKDLKLTFAKAEHLKRHAMEADDPKLIFQAMRPVFNDLVTEVQRSMGFFRSLNKKAEIGSILMLGNSVKLPGLAQYLSKNLAMDVLVLEKFELLTGDEVIAAPAFKEHVAAFGPVYGLCLQLLGKGPSQTNLVPKEVLQERLVRSKKPWAVAAAAILLLGFAGNLLPASGRWKTVAPEKWQSAMSAAENAKKASDAKFSEDGSLVKQVELLAKIGQEVSGNADRKLLCLEVINALYQALGRPPGDARVVPSPLDVPYNKRTDLHVTRIDSKYYEALSTWFTDEIKALYEEDVSTRLDRLGLAHTPADAASAEGGTEPAPAAAASDAEGEDTMGLPGWVFQINGYHYHNGKEYAGTSDELEEFVLKTLIHRLETGSIRLPTADGQMREFTFKEMGIQKPFVLTGKYEPDFKIPNPEWAKKYGNAAALPGDPGSGFGGGLGGRGGSAMAGGSGMPGGVKVEEDPAFPRFFDAPRYSFVVQLCWQERPLSARIEAQDKAAAAAAEAARAAAGESAEGDSDPAAGETSEGNPTAVPAEDNVASTDSSVAR